MSDLHRKLAQVGAILMVIFAAAWGAEGVRQAREADDGGPPLGALCMALPSIALLIGAAVMWSWTNPASEQNGFDVIQKK